MSVDKEEILRQMDKARPDFENIPDFLEGDNWWEEDVSEDWLSFDEPYTPPRWTLSHNGTPFANLGELHVITGKSGHGKTSFMTMLMVAILKGQYGGLRYELHEQVPFPKVLYIDTEQGKDDSIAIKNRVCVLCGENYAKPKAEFKEQFRVLRLREVEDAVERWRKILKAIWEMEPNICFLDGMLDIVNDYNDQNECGPIIRKCMKLATHFNMSMWCVLHENPTFDKMVGTLGSVLQRKVTEAFAVRKHKNESKPKAGMPPIYFSVEQLKARRFDQADWDFEVNNNAEGWGVPIELNEQGVVFTTTHNVEEVKQWITDGQNLLTWPAKRIDFYKAILEPHGITSDEEKRELTQMALNRGFIKEQKKSEMTKGQTNPKLKLNEDDIMPF